MKSQSQSFFEVISFPFTDFGSASIRDECQHTVLRELQKAKPFRGSIDAEVQIEPGSAGCMDCYFSMLGVPIVSKKFADGLRFILSDCSEFIPAKSKSGEWFFWNITCQCECIDRTRSVMYESIAKKVLEEDGIDASHLPDEVPLSLFIDANRAIGQKVFRLAEDTSFIVISGEVLAAILKTGVIGPGLLVLDGSQASVFPGVE